MQTSTMKWSVYSRDVEQCISLAEQNKCKAIPINEEDGYTVLRLEGDLETIIRLIDKAS